MTPRDRRTPLALHRLRARPRGERQNAFGSHAPPALQRRHAVQHHEHAADLPYVVFTAEFPLVAAPATVRLLLPCLHHQPGGGAGGCAIVVDSQLLVGDEMPWAL